MKLFQKTSPSIAEAAALFPIGQTIRYFPLKGERGMVQITKVRSEPWNLCGRTVVKIEGKAGGCDVTHMEAMDAPSEEVV